MDLGLRAVTVARHYMDPVGHYNGPDVFRLHVDTSPRPAVIETSDIAHQPYGGPDEDPISA